MSAECKPDEFLRAALELDELFEELGMDPIPALGETVVKRHLEVTPTDAPGSQSYRQQAAAHFGRVVFPAPLRPAS